jgi:hypothetical protein
MVSEGNGLSWTPSISCNGPNYGLSWQSGAEGLVPDSELLVNYIAFAELDGKGSPLVGPRPVEVSPETFSMLPTVVHRAGAYWVSWSDWGEDGYDARLAQSMCIED